MKTFYTKNAPEPVGAYSQAVKAGDLLFVSGQLGIDPASGELEKDLESQCARVFSNIEAILTEAGLSKQNVAKVTVYMSNMDDFAKVNKNYLEFFGEHKPARAAIGGLTLPLNGLLEIEVVASYTFS
ncbi:MAG: Rid family detoxifying hydrolase [Leptospirales bacterium]